MELLNQCERIELKILIMGQQSLGEETIDLVPIRGSKFRIPLI